MAIKRVDEAPGDAGKTRTIQQADAPPATREPDAQALAESVDPELPHARPTPKKRGPTSLQAASTAEAPPSSPSP